MAVVQRAEVQAVVPNWDDSLGGLADWAIAQAEAQLRLSLADAGVSFDALMADSERAPLVKGAIVNAARRVASNPSLARQWSETTGPFSRSETTDASASAGLVFIDDADLRRLLPQRRRRRFSSFHLNAGLGGW